VLTVVVIACALFGLLVGSFANVVIARIPAGRSIANPPSACPRCATRIRARDNIPVVSWLLLRGRCRDCAEPISVRYPLVELAMTVLFALVAWRVGLSWTLPGFLLFAWLLLVVAVIDIDTRKIPNKLTYPLTPALLVLLGAGAVLDGEPQRLLGALLGGLGAFAALLVIALISPRGMGFGDVKLAGFIGIGLGYWGPGHVVLGLFGAFLIGGVVAIALLALRARGRRDAIPFGPYLAAAAVLALLAGQPIITAYLRSAGLA
jgi:leader peptidase (prepilin peptidase) / N-methyltransferase